MGKPGKTEPQLTLPSDSLHFPFKATCLDAVDHFLVDGVFTMDLEEMKNRSAEYSKAPAIDPAEK